MPGLYDPTEAPESDRWFPEGQASFLLVACIQACKDILKIGGALDAARPSMDRRGLTLLATPVLSMVDNAVMLQRFLARKDRSSWPPKDQEAFTRFGRELRKASEGPLRKLRNTRSGHHDPRFLGPDTAPRPTPELLLPPLAYALLVLTLALNHEEVFTWIRVPDETKPDEIDYFLNVATRIRTVKDTEGHYRPREILQMTLTKDPRLEAFESIEATIALHNRLTTDAGYPQRQIVPSTPPPAPSSEPSQT